MDKFKIGDRVRREYPGLTVTGTVTEISPGLRYALIMWDNAPTEEHKYWVSQDNLFLLHKRILFAVWNGKHNE